MESNSTIATEKTKSVHALEATNFFLADVQTGLGPFLARAGWEGAHSFAGSVEDALGKVTTDQIRFVTGNHTERERAERDQDNALEAWPEHGLLGTQLGPNKNGKKW